MMLGCAKFKLNVEKAQKLAPAADGRVPAAAAAAAARGLRLDWAGQGSQGARLWLSRAD